MTLMEITELIESGEKTSQEKIAILKRIRGTLMDELHSKQQLVDQVDYMIYRLKEDEK